MRIKSTSYMMKPHDFSFIIHIVIERIRQKMLPIITQEQSTLCFAEIFQDVHGWRKKMIHYIKDENPEINSAIIEAAQNTDLDPKAVALGAYMTYVLLETAMKEESGQQVFTLDD